MTKRRNGGALHGDNPVMKADAEAGAVLFAQIKPQIVDAMFARGQQGGDARAVMLGFLIALGAYIARGAGLNAVNQVFNYAMKALKKATH